MELSKTALLSNVSWPEYASGLRVGTIQESLAEQTFTRDGWQVYPCDLETDPVIFKATHDAHLLPQLVWVSLTLDGCGWVGSLLQGESIWRAYEERGAALWEEYALVHRPVVLELLAMLESNSTISEDIGDTRHGNDKREIERGVIPNTDELIVKAEEVVESAARDLNGGGISNASYTMARELFLSIEVVKQSNIPLGPTCSRM
eukprot:TRINITY_DN56470_c0_g1_i1.p1 TRINITY_DN56470_c0_g1~~TRINITY_DN56470_c0_g1_i1.p1  ORF type:complete len:204 (-),score=29.99 TRINITY_DN56470_c0_g1_i1:141-752(-)